MTARAQKQGLVLQVIQGMTLPTLLQVLARNGFQVDASCLGRLAYLVAIGTFNSVFGACERIFNHRDIEASRPQQSPLFVLGHWRSGTTHLHNLLSLDERFVCPTAYQTSFPHHFIFSQVGGLIFNLLAPGTRPMDNMILSSATPHEDEFALAAHCAISPYLRFLFPVSGDHPHASINPLDLSLADRNRWKASMTLFLKKLALSEDGRPVLKSPPHTARVGMLLELFPDAQFVHIVRDPYAVYASTHKLWAKSLARAHLQIPSFELVDELILTWYEALFTRFQADRRLIPRGALVEVRFEDLERDPLGTLEQVYGGLRLGDFAAVAPALRLYLERISNYEKNRHMLDTHTRDKVWQRWGAVFERYGYVR